MDFAKIKNLVRLNGDKFIFLENGEPQIVMMAFEEYEKLLRETPHLSRPRKSGAGSYENVVFTKDERTEETEFVSSGVSDAASEKRGLPVVLEDIRLEDLPL